MKKTGLALLTAALICGGSLFANAQECTGVSFQLVKDGDFKQIDGNGNYAGAFIFSDQTLNQFQVLFDGEYKEGEMNKIYDLAEGKNTNYKACEQCVLLVRDYDQQGKPRSIMFQRSGKVEILEGHLVESNGKKLFGPKSKVEIRDLVLEEVTLDKVTNESTPVEGGECLEIEGVIKWDTTAPIKTDLNCQEIVNCVNGCIPSDQACMKGCAETGSAEGGPKFMTYMACLKNQCGSVSTEEFVKCAEEKCTSEYEVCMDDGKEDVDNGGNDTDVDVDVDVDADSDISTETDADTVETPDSDVKSTKTGSNSDSGCTLIVL